MASQYGSIVMSASQLQRKCHNHFDALLNRNSKTVNCRHLLNNTNRALKISKFYRFCHFLSNHLVLLKAAFRNNSCDIKTTRTNSAELTGTGDRSGSLNEREIWNLIVLCSKLWCEHRRTTCLHSSASLIDWLFACLIDWFASSRFIVFTFATLSPSITPSLFHFTPKSFPSVNSWYLLDHFHPLGDCFFRTVLFTLIDFCPPPRQCCDARYWYGISVRLSVSLSVCPTLVLCRDDCIYRRTFTPYGRAGHQSTFLNLCKGRYNIPRVTPELGR